MGSQYYRQGGNLGGLSIAGRLVICGKSVLQAGWWFVGSHYYRQAGEYGDSVLQADWRFVGSQYYRQTGGLWEVSITGRLVSCEK